MFNNLGIIQNRQGEDAKAVESYQSALKIDSDNFFPNYNLGVLQAGQGNEKCVTHFLLALSQAKKM